ncbi:hypothetical protein GHR28_04890 [Escherichia coli]|nr:hypothetical protein [Escherichia coli]
MNVFEMEGFLRGKCLPGDMKVNETTAEYLVRKLDHAGELTAAHSTIEKAREVTNCPQGVELQEHLKALVAENLAIKSAAILLADESVQIYKRWNLTQQPDGDIVDMQTIHELLCACHETPATDSILREAEARGVDKAIEHLLTKFACTGHVGVPAMALEYLARQLRGGNGE